MQVEGVGTDWFDFCPFPTGRNELNRYWLPSGSGFARPVQFQHHQPDLGLTE